MRNSVQFGVGLLATLFLPAASAQNDVWNGLARSQFDSDDLTLRIPCAVLFDDDRNTIPGFAPAYALNLLLLSLEPDNERFRLVDPIQAFEIIPESCLDTLTLASDGLSAIYSTTSTEIDTDAAVNADRFYTLELLANLATDGPIEFSVISAESRDYRSPDFLDAGFFANAGPQPFPRDFIYDDAIIEQGKDAIIDGLLIFEPGRVIVDCFFVDPEGLLEVVEVIGSNTRYRLRSTLTSADNNRSFSLRCTVFNHDINRLEDVVDLLTWSIFLE